MSLTNNSTLLVVVASMVIGLTIFGFGFSKGEDLMKGGNRRRTRTKSRRKGRRREVKGYSRKNR